MCVFFEHVKHLKLGTLEKKSKTKRGIDTEMVIICVGTNSVF